MRLVNDDGVVRLQQRVSLRLGQQNTVGHQLDRRILAQPVVETHLVTHHIAQGRVQLFGNPLGHAAGRNPAGLGVADELAAFACGIVEFAAAHGQGNFGQLCGFARARFAADDDHLVRRNGIHDFVAFARHRERLWEFDFQGAGSQGVVFVENHGLSPP